MNGTPDIPKVSDEGNRALLAAQFALFAYICALVGDTQDAQDVLQETNLKLCRELGAYDPSRPFLPWAKRVAYYEVLSYRTRKSRDRLTLADDSFFEQVAEATADAPTSRVVIAKQGGITQANSLADANGYFGWNVKRGDWGFGTFNLTLTFPVTVTNRWDATLVRLTEGFMFSVK